MMAALIDELEVGRWVKTTAETATGLDAFLDVIPESHPLPAVRYTCQMRHDVYTVEATAPFSRFLWLVLVVVDNDVTELGELRAIEKALHEGMHDQAGVVGECNVVSCVRAGTFVMSENEGGRIYRHAGGTYTIQARPA